MFTFENEDAIVCKAQEILYKRAYVKPDAERMISPENLKPMLDMMALDLAGHDVEEARAYYFTPDGKFIRSVLVGKGDETMTLSPPREIARQGLLCNASFAAIAHNHPNGDSTPSDEDANHALKVAQALGTVGLELLGAYVVAGPRAKDVVAVEPPQPKALSLSDILSRMRTNN